MVDELTPDRDASLGLVFRLNKLWSRVDDVSINGNYLKWNDILDAIYRSLLYREDIITNVDEKTGIVTNVIFSNKDVKVYRYLSLQIAKARKNHKTNRNLRTRNKTQSIWYHTIQKKDIWLRKFMQKLRLYMKETEKRPGSTMYGAIRRKRR